MNNEGSDLALLQYRQAANRQCSIKIGRCAIEALGDSRQTGNDELEPEARRLRGRQNIDGHSIGVVDEDDKLFALARITVLTARSEGRTMPQQVFEIGRGPVEENGLNSVGYLA